MTFYLLITVVITYQIIGITQAVLHRYIGHKRLIPFVFDSHTKSHHTIYNSNCTFESTVYSKEEASISYTFIPFAMLIAGMAYLSLPFFLFITALLTVIASFIMQVYLHAQFHLANSRLQRFSWFKRCKEIHRIHHMDQTSNFGLINFNCDRIMGTFVSPEIENESGEQA